MNAIMMPGTGARRRKPGPGVVGDVDFAAPVPCRMTGKIPDDNLEQLMERAARLKSNAERAPRALLEELVILIMEESAGDRPRDETPRMSWIGLSASEFGSAGVYAGFSPLAKSALISPTASNPTAIRNSPSVIPAASRLSWLIRACVVVAG